MKWKTKWTFETAAITTAKVALPNVLKRCSKADKMQMFGHYTIKNSAFNCAITVKIHAVERAGCLDCKFTLKRDILMKTDSYQSSS